MRTILQYEWKVTLIFLVVLGNLKGKSLGVSDKAMKGEVVINGKGV